MDNIKIVDVRWFCGRSNVGVVCVEDTYDEPKHVKYYIGSPPMNEYSPNSEWEDINWIADWGSRFPKEAGDKLFGR